MGGYRDLKGRSGIYGFLACENLISLPLTSHMGQILELLVGCSQINCTESSGFLPADQSCF